MIIKKAMSNTQIQRNEKSLLTRQWPQHLVLMTIIVDDRNQGVEVFIGELVLEEDTGINFSATAEGGELGDEGIELDVAVDGEDLGLTTNEVKLVVVGTRVDQTCLFSFCL